MLTVPRAHLRILLGGGLFSELSVFRDMLHYGSPKFLAPTAPDYDSLTDDHSTESYRLQQKIFEADVKETLKLPVIRSYLKLYSTMPIEKLAAFLALVRLRRCLCRPCVPPLATILRAHPPMKTTGIWLDLWAINTPIMLKTFATLNFFLRLVRSNRTHLT